MVEDGDGDIARLLEALHNRDNEVRWPATDALVAIGAAAVPGLLEKLHDEKRSLRVLTIKTLRRIGHPSAVPGLIELLEDEEQVVVEATCYALLALADARAVPALESVLTSAEKAHFPTACARRLRLHCNRLARGRRKPPSRDGGAIEMDASGDDSCI